MYSPRGVPSRARLDRLTLGEETMGLLLDLEGSAVLVDVDVDVAVGTCRWWWDRSVLSVGIERELMVMVFVFNPKKGSKRREKRRANDKHW